MRVPFVPQGTKIYEGHGVPYPQELRNEEYNNKGPSWKDHAKEVCLFSVREKPVK